MNQEDIETIPTAKLLEELENRVSTIRCEINPLPEDVITIIGAICKHFGTTETQLFSGSKVKSIAWARMAALTCINCAGHSNTATAAVFRMDHSNVTAARKRVQHLRSSDRVFRQRFIDTLDTIAKSEHPIATATA